MQADQTHGTTTHISSAKILGFWTMNQVYRLFVGFRYGRHGQPKTLVEGTPVAHEKRVFIDLPFECERKG